jgi:hypothetical protein
VDASGELYLTAHKAGLKALLAVTPSPVVVVERANPLDENSAIVDAEYVPGGLCGFAWVVIKPGSSDFARWLLRKGLARRREGGGIQIWVGGGGQSVECKEVYARAFAEVLRANGIDAYAESRLD